MHWFIQNFINALTDVNFFENINDLKNLTLKGEQ